VSEFFSEFFNLELNPFGETPDARFYFDSTIHNSALNKLAWAIEQGRGFSLLTGEVGTGKTLVSRILLGELGENANTALILYPKLNDVELLAAIAHELEIPNVPTESTNATTRQYLEPLNRFLLEAASRGRKSVLVVDEAQHLSYEALEAIRLLSNLETEREKLLQIILVAQPELQTKLETRELRQLQQRICVHANLNPLSLQETDRYIKHRLEIAGNANLIRFSSDAVGEIHQLSGGIPRNINKFCELVILFAQNKRTRLIDRKLVREVCPRPKNKRSFFSRWIGNEVRWP
jgi:general secretion pathway protein A